MDKEKLGALIDAVYAIAMTILVLELPVPTSDQELHQSISEIALGIVDYALSFSILLAFWFNQRRINDLFVRHTRLTLSLHGFTLLLICLLPFSANLLYKLGGEVQSLFHFNHDAFVDLFFVSLCLLADLSMHVSLWLAHRLRLHEEQNTRIFQQMQRTRIIGTLILFLALFLAFALPGRNRWSLVVIPILFIAEDNIMRFCDRLLAKKAQN